MTRIISFILFLPHILLFLFSSKKKIIIADLYARSPNQPLQLLKIILDLSKKLFSDRYFRTLFYFRTSGIVSKMLRIFYPREKYFIIDINTRIGKGVKLAHPYSSILNAESIGDNLYVNHLVTVGEKNGKKPIIGDNVQIHAGAFIIGNVKIGDNAIIGAGSVVIKDVPENSIVVGNPARIIKMNV